MAKSNPLVASANDAAILDRVIRPRAGNLPIVLARQMLRLKFSDDDAQRINELSAKAGEGALNPVEDAELDSYIRVGHFLSMMKSKARLTLKKSGRS